MKMKKCSLAVSLAVLAASASQTTLAQGDLVLEEVVVTAQKRTENLQDVPSTVNAVSGQQIEDLQLFEFADLEIATAGLSLSNLDERNVAVGLRGVAQNPDSAASPTVEVYWNGLTIFTPYAFDAIYDMSRVEVLRGPQGVLQGKTSPSGSIQLYTRRASTDGFSGFIHQAFSDNDLMSTQVAVNVPLIDDTLAIRVAGNYVESAGQDIENITTGENEFKRSRGGRFSLHYSPTDTLSMDITHQYGEATSNLMAHVAGSDPFGTGKPDLGVFDRKALYEGRNTSLRRHSLSNLTLNWEVMGHELTYLYGYYNNDSEALRDRDYGNVIPNLERSQGVLLDQRYNIHELRIASTENETLEYTAGLYYDNYTSYTIVDPSTVNVWFSPDPSIPPAFSLISVIDIPNPRENFGVFGNLKFNVTAATALQVGARWQKARAFRATDVNTFLNGVNVSFTELIPNELKSETSEAVTGSIKLMHYWNDDILVYGSVDKGYRPGGVTISPTPLSANTLIFEEEESISYELGFKATLSGGRATLNGNIFYQSFDNYIARSEDIFADSNAAPGGSGADGIAETSIVGGITYNGDAIIQGFELEANSLLTENWTLSTSLSYTDAKFDGANIPTNFFNEAGQAIIPADQAGAEIATRVADSRVGEEPNLSFSATSEYGWDLGANRAYIRGIFKYNGSRGNDLVANADTSGYSVTNLYLGYGASDRQWEVTFWAKNLFDKQALTRVYAEDVIASAATNINFSAGYARIRIIPEREIGVSLKYNFGG
jgi:outer membrane receptor protein involved in Fe transport